MKFVLFLAAAVFASATATYYWEPTEDTKFCQICSDPLVRSYDAAYLMVTDEQKTTFSNYRNKYDKCKFSLRGVTNFDFHVMTGPLYLDWVGFGFDQHSNPNRGNGKNYIFGQSTDCIAVRGQGFDGPTPLELPTGYNFAVDNHVEYDPATGGVHLRSSTCEYALDWYPAGFDTCMTFWIGDYYTGGSNNYRLGGICGTADDIMINDWKTKSDEMVPMTAQGLEDISDSWKSGAHQGGAFVGSERFENECVLSPIGTMVPSGDVWWQPAP